jgi:hypothetical protein
MSGKEKLIENIEVFYSEIIEEYKDISLAIRSEATPLAIFKKKKYQQHIDGLRKCKKDIARVNPKDIKLDPKDEAGMQLKEAFEHALFMFNGLCDSQIQVQVALQNTAEKKGGKFSDCSDATKKMNEQNRETEKSFHQLDVLYADYLE